jgi:hypothetical protein
MEILEVIPELLTKFYKDGKLDILLVIGSFGAMVRIAVAQIKKLRERIDLKDIEDARRDKDIEYLRKDVDRIDKGDGEGKLNAKF